MPNVGGRMRRVMVVEMVYSSSPARIGRVFGESVNKSTKQLAPTPKFARPAVSERRRRRRRRRLRGNEGEEQHETFPVAAKLTCGFTLTPVIERCNLL